MISIGSVMKQQLLFTGVIFIPFLLSAQTDFRSGYVIKAANDTLKGEIDLKKEF